MNKELFKRELEKLDIKYTEDISIKLQEYYQILIEENSKYNLTSITNEDEAYLKHFYDSLTITKIIDLNNQSLLDIGTGAGFPGLVLKIFFPDLNITLLDSTSKKCNFLNLVISKLSLKNIKVVNERAEEYSRLNREMYDIVTSRAVAPLKHLLEYSIPLVKVDGIYIAMKANIEEETKNIENYLSKLNLSIIEKINFTLPIENSQRTLIKFKKHSKTDLKYPRKYNEIKKREI